MKLLTLLEQADRQKPNLLRVLTYHRVAESAIFSRQMSYLSTNYRPVSMDDVREAWCYGKDLPARSVLVTFDDAYVNFSEVAWPILKQHRIPATLFVATAFPGQPERGFWWDRLQEALHQTNRRDEVMTPAGHLPLGTPKQRRYVYRRLRDHVKSLPHSEAMKLIERLCHELDAPPSRQRVLNWDELRRLHHEGVTLGAHSQTHPLMNRVSLAEARAEIIGARLDLEREVGPVLPIFAYPSGGFTNEVVQILDREGFELAFTIVRGTNDLRTADRLRLRRNNVGEHATANVLRIRLLQSSVYLNRWRPLSGVPRSLSHATV